ncbi:PilZ domain-containing protein [Novosphingobium sp. JCM 18896]|uniref:PilZ domain-containing protein n=1 Tax=Novosphingobium sp. JCM 18896 TaxID=2989731 RepID=UPI002221E3D6|nr:PilZ domain-containing protein [Novosphingobium sp. JCM 18896]MCW1430200.1 PilZ domain-containing protein [Novosphingobium sp. JCM 18896]
MTEEAHRPSPISRTSVDNAADRRTSERFPLLIDSRCTIGGGRTADVWLIDISRTGCQVFNYPGPFSPGAGVIVFDRHGEGVAGNVAWVSGTKAGVKFEIVLSDENFARIQERPPSAPSATEDLDPMVDQFGRVLAPLSSRAYRRAS